MKKYFYILKMQVMSNLQYIFNLFIQFLTYAIIIYIYLNLWKYIYSDPSELINGYTMKQMIWYVVFTEILWMALGGRALVNKISKEVKSGDIATKINKPYSYIGYAMFYHSGDIVIKFIFYVIFGFLLGFIFLGSFPDINIIGLLLVLLTSILAFIISMLLIISIGLLSFFIEDSSPLYWIYSKLILVTGTLFPIEFFPGIIRTILTYSPIYVVSYGPAKLFVDFSYPNAFRVIIAQSIYIIIGLLICNFVYRRGVKRINVNGG